MSAEARANSFRMPSDVRLGYVHLTVADLEKQILFYTRVLGFHVHWKQDGEAALGSASEVLLRLSELPQAKRYQRSSGMYHFALLYPNRKELARAVARLFALRYPNAPTDHGISKTTYLDDLEGNTIELYVRSLDDAVYEIVDGDLRVRYANGRIGTGRDPLDLDALFSELNDNDSIDLPLPEGTQVGHMHLYVSSLERSLEFYASVLGFEEGPIFPNFRMGEVGIDALQPHVIAFNTWKGHNLPPAPADALGIQYFTIVLPSRQQLDQVVEQVQAAGLPTETSEQGIVVYDPAQIKVVLTDRMPSLQP
jgi:Predicted ring-cleavage extradiol dioxygenase